MNLIPKLPSTFDQEIIRGGEPEIQAELSDPERLEKIRREFDEGFRIMEPVGPAVADRVRLFLRKQKEVANHHSQTSTRSSE